MTKNFALRVPVQLYLLVHTVHGCSKLTAGGILLCDGNVYFIDSGVTYCVGILLLVVTSVVIEFCSVMLLCDDGIHFSDEFSSVMAEYSSVMMVSISVMNLAQ